MRTCRNYLWEMYQCECSVVGITDPIELNNPNDYVTQCSLLSGQLSILSERKVVLVSHVHAKARIVRVIKELDAHTSKSLSEYGYNVDLFHLLLRTVCVFSSRLFHAQSLHDQYNILHSLNESSNSEEVLPFPSVVL